MRLNLFAQTNANAEDTTTNAVDAVSIRQNPTLHAEETPPPRAAI